MIDSIEAWRWNDHCGRSLEEALSELEREAGVRKRCYDRWVAEGKLTSVDARDRMERLISAIMILREMELAAGRASVPKTGDKPSTAQSC
jgi:hypothetical protein